jgi:phosphate transport system protein
MFQSGRTGHEQAMTKHLHRDLTALHHEILALSAIVEEMIDKATLALCEGRVELAAEVIATDEQVDEREVRIEEECLKMLALHQPVAIDLRRIATVMKVNNDLERIADLAVNMAERSQALAEHPAFPIPVKLSTMAELAMQMVHTVLDFFVNMDATGARRVMLLDDKVDALNVEIIHELHARMQAAPEAITPSLYCFSAARHIERIADHATNIAEDIIYLVEGTIVRHQHQPLPAS